MSNKRIHITILLLSILSFVLLAAKGSSSSGTSSSSDPLKQAAALTSAHLYSKAEAIYQQIKTENPGSDKALEAQKQLIHIAITQRDQKKAEAAFNQMVSEFSGNTKLAEAIYNVGKYYQYNVWNAQKANQTHKYNIEHFPDTKYAMLSSVEIVRSSIRSGNKTADAEVDSWINTYKNQPDSAMGIYQLARAYAAQYQRRQ
jgi:tetratricopeptide (TPR) repeat protein